jgi:hypothetical protein
MTEPQLPIVERAEHGKLGWMVNKQRLIPYSRECGIAPYFSNLITKRINQQRSCNILVNAEAGIGKSYCSIALARYLQGKSFKSSQICFTYSEYMKLQLEEPQGHVLVLDEPEFYAGARTWYETAQKCLIATTRSARFRVHPLIIPCISKALLDVTIRRYLVQYVVWMTDRGEAEVYRLSPSRFTNDVFQEHFCTLYIEMLDRDKCDREWCLDCPKFLDNSCKLLRSQYEHKRQDLQLSRYRDDYEATKKVENTGVSFAQLEELAVKIRPKWVWNKHSGNIDIPHLQLLFEQEYDIHLSENKSILLGRRLTAKYKGGEKSVN